MKSMVHDVLTCQTSCTIVSILARTLGVRSLLPTIEHHVLNPFFWIQASHCHRQHIPKRATCRKMMKDVYSVDNMMQRLLDSLDRACFFFCKVPYEEKGQIWNHYLVTVKFRRGRRIDSANFFQKTPDKYGNDMSHEKSRSKSSRTCCERNKNIVQGAMTGELGPLPVAATSVRSLEAACHLPVGLGHVELRSPATMMMLSLRRVM